MAHLQLLILWNPGKYWLLSKLKLKAPIIITIKQVIKGTVTCKNHNYLEIIGSVRLVYFYHTFWAWFWWVKNGIQNGLLPLPLLMFWLWSIWDGPHVMSLKERMRSIHTLFMVRGFPVVYSFLMSLGELIKCCTAAIPPLFSAFVHIFTRSCSWWWNKTKSIIIVGLLEN